MGRPYLLVSLFSSTWRTAPSPISELVANALINRYIKPAVTVRQDGALERYSAVDRANYSPCIALKMKAFDQLLRHTEEGPIIAAGRFR